MVERKRLPPGTFAKFKALVKELEEAEGAEKARIEEDGGEIELKISADETLWYAAYKTSAM